MVQTARKLSEWWASLGTLLCLWACIFAPSRRIASPEAEALQSALSWTTWPLVTCFAVWGLAWTILRLRKPTRRSVLGDALARVSMPPADEPAGALHDWLGAAFHALLMLGQPVVFAPAILETAISVGSPRALIASLGLVGLVLIEGWWVVHFARRAVLPGRAASVLR